VTLPNAVAPGLDGDPHLLGGRRHRVLLIARENDGEHVVAVAVGPGAQPQRTPRSRTGVADDKECFSCEVSMGDQTPLDGMAGG